uniref:hypothetical protein n=1 Tax=Amycolatopsis sp. CA-151526 TaxID=3239921 RepID=UPI003F497471
MGTGKPAQPGGTVPKRFGEQISEKEAYDTARGAAKHIKNLSTLEKAADTPLKKQALADEQASRHK